MRPLRFAHLFAAWFIALVIIGLPAYLIGLLFDIGSGSLFWKVAGAVAALVMLIVMGLFNDREQDRDPEPDDGRRYYCA